MALIVLLPRAKLLPLTVRVAFDPEIVADPRVVLPSLKLTVPVAAALPTVGFTVAVSTVLPDEAMFDGLAATVVIVGAAIMRVVVPVELEKLPVAA